jgi:hypothetical protein
LFFFGLSILGLVIRPFWLHRLFLRLDNGRWARVPVWSFLEKLDEVHAMMTKKSIEAKKEWRKPVVSVITAGSAETSGGSAQEGGTGPATHAS